LALYPSARNYVVEMKYKPKPRFVDGFFAPDGKGTRRTLVGRMFPQPIVMRPEGKLVLFDEALSVGFALVAFGQSPERALAHWVQPIWDNLECAVSAFTRCPVPYRTKPLNREFWMRR
jgi:3-(3-hydroxy-phenyl)propionate hydroxylase